MLCLCLLTEFDTHVVVVIRVNLEGRSARERDVWR